MRTFPSVPAPSLTRTLLALFLIAAGACAAGQAAWAQHAPRIARGLEVGAELRFSDDVITFAGIAIGPIGSRTDARGGFGILSPDEGDSEVFLTGGLRYLAHRRTGRFPLDVALDGELNLLLLDDAVVQIIAGPSFGGPVGSAGALIPYVQPLLAISTGGGDSETDFGVRLGADYALTETVDLRGDVLIADDTELRVALYFRL
jgi:hypothetical protein